MVVAVVLFGSIRFLRVLVFVGLANVLMVINAIADNYWYCSELESVGLRYHFGHWTTQEFHVTSHLVEQNGLQLDLKGFGMLPKTTRCFYDHNASIISCSDYYTLFNLNIDTGNAAMAYVSGWVNQRAAGSGVPNDLSVTAIHCKPISPATQSPGSTVPAPPGAVMNGQPLDLSRP